MTDILDGRFWWQIPSFKMLPLIGAEVENETKDCLYLRGEVSRFDVAENEYIWKHMKHIWNKEIAEEDGQTWGEAAWTWLQSWCGRAGSAGSKSTCTKRFTFIKYCPSCMCCMVACVVGSDETGQGLLPRIILEGDIRLLWKHVPGVELDVEGPSADDSGKVCKE